VSCHFPLLSKFMNPVKAKCDAYRTMVKAEAKFIEAKENYYTVNK